MAVNVREARVRRSTSGPRTSWPASPPSSRRAGSSTTLPLLALKCSATPIRSADRLTVSRTSAGSISRESQTVRSTRAARPAVVHETANSVLLDGNRALGLAVATQALDLAVDRALRSGITIVGVKNSTHFGCAGYYGERAANRRSSPSSRRTAALERSCEHRVASYPSSERIRSAWLSPSTGDHRSCWT